MKSGVLLSSRRSPAAWDGRFDRVSSSPKHRMGTLFRWAALGLSLGACNLTEPTCTLEARVAIQVDVIDAAARVPVNGATLILRRDNLSSVEMQEFPGSQLVGGYDAGTYHLTVRKAGYQDWTRGRAGARGGPLRHGADPLPHRRAGARAVAAGIGKLNHCIVFHLITS